MHRKAVFALAGIFLIIALAVPPVLFVIQADKDLDDFIKVQNNQGLVTGSNVTITPDEFRENHTNTFIASAVIEAVFIPLFAVALYYGINNPNPQRKKDEAEP
jgi:hypothetical protein